MVKRSPILTFLRELFFPPKCAACQTLLEWRTPSQAHSPREALCATCLKKWENEQQETCGICTKKVTECLCVPTAMQKAGCRGFCKLVYYSPRKSEPVQNRLIYHIKRHSDEKTPTFLAAQLLPTIMKYLEENQIDPSSAIFTYLPRSGRSALQYGTDQAKTLARALSKQSGIAFSRLILRNRGANRAQKTLSAAERLDNAKMSFRPANDKSCKNCTVLLVDDLVTTGAGMAICAKHLYKMGADNVFCIAIASDETNKDTMPHAKSSKKN